MTNENTPTIVHPTAVARGRWYYAAGQVWRLAGNAATLLALCLVLAYPTYLFSWITFGVVVLVFASPWVQRRIFFAAWAEVPGAFARPTWSIEEGDRRRPRAVPVDYVTDGFVLALTVAVGAWIAWYGLVPTTRAAAVLGGFGAWVVVVVLGTLARDLYGQRIPRRADYIVRGSIQALGGVAWIVFGAIIDAPTARGWALTAVMLAVIWAIAQALVRMVKRALKV